MVGETSKGPLFEAQRRTSIIRRLTLDLSSAITIAMITRTNMQYAAAHELYWIKNLNVVSPITPATLDEVRQC